MRDIYRVGIPTSFEHVFWQIAALILTRIILSYGETSLAAYQLGLQAESISYTPAAGFGIAATALIGQRLGAGQGELARTYFSEITKYTLFVTVCTALLLLLFPAPIMGLLTKEPEVIAIADAGFRGLGLDGFRLEITSLGDDTCRPQYRELLQEFLFGLPLDEETRRRAEINPLRVLDDKRPQVREMTADAPLMLDHLSDTAKAHFDEVLRHLDALAVPYVVNPRMVRGLDYYTKTTFEFVHDGLGAQSGIGGGGRYDGLMEQLGGQPLSGIGFGLGVDRTILALAAEGKSAATPARCEVYGVPMGDEAKAALVPIAHALRGAGIRVDLAYGGRGLKGAMKAADKSGAAVALVLGDRELEAGEIVLKDLRDGDQHTVPLGDVVARVGEVLVGR